MFLRKTLNGWKATVCTPQRSKGLITEAFASIAIQNNDLEAGVFAKKMVGKTKGKITRGQAAPRSLNEAMLAYVEFIALLGVRKYMRSPRNARILERKSKRWRKT